MKTFAFIFSIVALVAMVAIVATLPLRIKKLTKKLGNCLLPLSRKQSMLFVAVLCFAPLMIIFQWFRTFEFYIHIILSITAILAIEIVIRERVYDARSGVYENALIVDGRLFEKNDIIALPTLEYENDPEAEENPEDFPSLNDPAYRKALKIVTNKNGVLFVGFETEEERNKAVEIIKHWV